MRINSFLGHLAIVSLFAFTWSIHAFCSEIHDAVKSGDLAEVKSVLNNHPDLVSGKDDDGYTALHIAAIYGHKDIARLLLANGADVNAKDKWGETPLHCSANNNHKDIAELLITNKADINAKNEDGWTPLHSAASTGNISVVKLLVENKADLNAKTSKGPQRLFVVDAGLNDSGAIAMKTRQINKADNISAACNRWTPLLLAVLEDKKDVVVLLLTAKAGVNTMTSNGWTPLQWALSKGYKDIAELLRQHGGHE